MSTELATILRHAGTVLVGQLAVMAFGITDTLVAGHFADTALAALSVASATYITIHISLMGLLQALLPVWAELHGAGRQADVGRSLRQALYLCAITILIGMGALLLPGPLLRWTQVPLELQAQVQDYLTIVAFGVPASLLFRLYSTLNQSLGKPKLVTWVQVGALAVKVPLSILLVLGIPGWLAPMGLVGCAWATLAVNCLMLALALWLLRTQDFYKPFQIWAPMEAPNGAVLLRFLRLGLPSGLAIGVEVTSFTLMSLFIARLGVVASASHQIVANMAAVLYMVPLALSIASSARISYWLGADQVPKARRALRTGFSLVLLMCLSLSLLLWTQRTALASVYTQSPAVATLAATLLAWLVLYHFADAIQVFCVFALRCYGVTLLPLVTYTVLLWGVGLAGGYVVAYAWPDDRAAVSWLTPQSPLAFWQTSSLALCFTAALLLAVLWRVAYRQRDRTSRH
ncbi:MATE family efflux transporter [Limnohabitans sp.]|uniref:MATE family efflux transporter n=1 Tax=Limnohabitans sp. TaxID=1907725 RepID=UPI00286F16C6|nr:MATE family efflux transporter [Limnohabitans sp.]